MAIILSGGGGGSVSIPDRETAPSNPKVGDKYIDLSTNTFKRYNGTSWDTIGGSGEGGGSITVTEALQNGKITINGVEYEVYDDSEVQSDLSSIEGRVGTLETKPGYDDSELRTLINGKANTSHTHAKSDITGLDTLENRIATLEQSPSGAGGDTVTHSGTNGSITVNGVDVAVYNDSEVKDLIATKADITHGHTMNQVSGLNDALAAKADVNHTHQDLSDRITTLENTPQSSGGTTYDDTEIRSEIALKADKTELHTHSNKTLLDGFSLDADGKTLLLNGSKVDTKGVNTYASENALPEGQPHGTLATVGANIYVFDANADPVKVEKTPSNMTANNDGSGYVAYSNSENTGTESYKAFDNSTTTFFAPAANLGSGVKYVGLTLPAAVLVDTFDFLPYGNDSAGYNPKNWKVEGLLEDGVTWTTLYSNTAETWTAGVVKTFTFTPVKIKDFRITTTATHLSSYKPYIKDVNVYGTIAGKWIKISAKEVYTQTIAAAGNASITSTKTNPTVNVQIATANAGEYRNIKDSDAIDVLITGSVVKVVNNGTASATLKIIIS